MSNQTDPYLDTEAAKRRRNIYILCGLVVLGCAAAFLLLSAGDHRQQPAARGVPAEPGAGTGPGPGKPVDVDSRGAGAHADLPDPADDDPRRADLRRADALFDEGLGLLREAMTGDLGSDAASKARRDAHERLMAARAAYEKYMADYPDQESALDKRITELVGHIHWCRKGMTSAEIDELVTPPALDAGETEVVSRPPPAEGRPGAGRAPTPVPRAVPRQPAFRPDQAAAKFQAAARRALADGRPDRILELGRPLVEDPRMEGHLGDIPGIVTLAEGMERVLRAARAALSGKTGEAVVLSLRKGEVAGTLVLVEEAIVLETTEGERRLHAGELGAKTLLTLAELGGGLPDAAARRAAGAYFLLRGDVDAGARQLIRARSLGADIEAFQKRIEGAMRSSPELRALASWYALSPVLIEGSADLNRLVGAFKKAHRNSEVFAEHREEIFRACARNAEANPFRLEDLYCGAGKVDKRGVHLTYDFEDPAQLADFGTQGTFKIEDGVLRCDRGAAWLQRFEMKSVDFRFVMEQAGPIQAALWPRAGGGREGIILRVEITPGGLSLSLLRRDRPFARETVSLPRGEVEIVMKKREDKYQVWVNRKLAVKATDKMRRRGEDPVAVGFAHQKEPLAVSEMELKTGLDLEWARAGGKRFSTWVEDWHLAGPFPNPSKDLKEALTSRWWPETGEVDLEAKDDQGEARWKYVQVTERLDLRAAFRSRKPCTGYAVVRVWSPKKRTAVLDLEVDDDARAWLNGDLALAQAPIGSPHRAAVKLVQGDNLLVVKVADAGGGYWLKARFLEKSGEPMRDLQYW